MSASSMLAEHANRHGLELQRLETALEWQVSHWSGDMSDQDLKEWAAWLASHSGNQHAWHEVERLSRHGYSSIASKQTWVARSIYLRTEP